ncbi:site-specific DNA-methyltransferase [Candidatus Nitrosotenuis aquarius]|uniref:site-specific DNA-methyltransferase n=1 Tax=Candidatus Nitrosotenuis aquarius TaxID=1846278 RepID=UPI000C1F1440|nr:site-specific DNA-methyltransferase [Candidatus Nitrosotenuis aquarius]
MTNILIHSDSLSVLKDTSSKKANLIYLDPPFFTNRSFESDSYDGKRITFDDVWKNGISEYLNFMRNVLQESLRILHPTGMLFLHCDWHASHYLKVELDKIFGYHNFVNEIIWKRHNSQNNSKQGAKIFGRMHDTILVYSKTKDYTWNQIYDNYSDEYKKRAYRNVDGKTGERYALGDLSGPGGASKGNPRYEFLGFTKYWRYSKQKMLRLYKEGKIVQTRPNTVPKLKRYLKDMKGIPLSDIWSDINNHQIKNRKSILYPTQKPIELLDRIIRCSTKKGDLVLDPFCGSGTTLISAHKLQRNWVGIDKNHVAIDIVKRRLQESGVLESEYKLLEEPLKINGTKRRKFIDN